MMLIIIAYIVLGCFLEGDRHGADHRAGVSAAGQTVRLRPVWFGIIVVIVVEVGLIHPPVGHEPVRHSGAGARHQDHRIYRGIVPFLVAPLILIVLMFLFPAIALWLPKLLYG